MAGTRALAILSPPPAGPPGHAALLFPGRHGFLSCLRYRAAPHLLQRFPFQLWFPYCDEVGQLHDPQSRSHDLLLFGLVHIVMLLVR